MVKCGIIFGQIMTSAHVEYEAYQVTYEGILKFGQAVLAIRFYTK